MKKAQYIVEIITIFIMFIHFKLFFSAIARKAFYNKIFGDFFHPHFLKIF
jgi:hypothetical protein